VIVCLWLKFSLYFISQENGYFNPIFDFIFFLNFQNQKTKNKNKIKPKKYVFDVFAPFSAFFPKNFKK